MDVIIESPYVTYSENFIDTVYKYQNVTSEQVGSSIIVTPREATLNIRTERKVPRLGLMLIGWGGNNGSTVTAAILANKYNITWKTKTGPKTPNWYGSLTQSSTVNLGYNSNNEPIVVPMCQLLPMVNPNDIVVDGWDISSLNLADAMERAEVIDYDLQKKLVQYMRNMKPRPSIYYPDYIAPNQSDRADNIFDGCKWDQLNKIQADIRDCKETNQLDKIILIWTANTERYSEVIQGVNDTTENLLYAIKSNSPHVSPSTVFAVAAILEGVCTQNSNELFFFFGCIVIILLFSVCIY